MGNPAHYRAGDAGVCAHWRDCSANNPKAARRYEYDDNGNLKETDARVGLRDTYTCDALNRNTTVDYANTVNPISRVTTTTHPTTAAPLLVATLLPTRWHDDQPSGGGRL
jgi:YD repeat-containing protein